MKMQGYNGSQSWDTSFAVQALAAGGPELARRHAETLARTHAYLDATQIKNDVPMRERFFRTISKGGWPFSTNGEARLPLRCMLRQQRGKLFRFRSCTLFGSPVVAANTLADHGWPIADCTAEGMKATLAVRSLALDNVIDVGTGPADGFGGLRSGLIAPQRYYDAVEVLFAFQNPDGGWATYEEMRGGPW